MLVCSAGSEADNEETAAEDASGTSTPYVLLWLLLWWYTPSFESDAHVAWMPTSLLSFSKPWLSYKPNNKSILARYRSQPYCNLPPAVMPP
jgi:hypothetical protein